MASPRHPNDILMPLLGRRIRLGNHEYEMKDSIWNGPFSSVYLVEENGIPYAMKVEPQSKALRPVLKLDKTVLSALGHQTGFPHLIDSGRTEHFKYIVMQLVGTDLSRLLEMAPGQKFTPSTIYKIALQTLDRLRVLHEAGWLNRDVKIPNFAVGLGEESNIVYTLDFGLTRRYLERDGTQLLLRPHGPSVGTFPYAPLSSVSFCDQSPIDDVEGWLYMIVHLLKGGLPWQNPKMHLDLSKTREWKMYCRRPGGKHYLFSGLPQGWADIFDVIVKTGPHKTPDYNQISKMVLSIARNERIDLSAPFDWQVDPTLRSLVGLGPFNRSSLASLPMSSMGILTTTFTDQIRLNTIVSPIGTC